MREIIEIAVNEIEDKIIEHRRRIHSEPELSGEEYKTAQYIEDVLNNIGISTSRFANTGVVGIIGNGTKRVALRADIDALGIQEETGLEFSSKNNNIMHACGHDLHAAMLLGAAEVLKSIESQLDGEIMLIFQPHEELLPGGAIQMLDAGLFDEKMPNVIFGQHIDPDGIVGNLAMADGAVMASADELYWTLQGKGSHAAQPHLGNDPIIAAAALVQHFQTLTNKFKNPLKPGVLSVTSIIAGTANNIFPDSLEMKGTLRSFDEDWRLLMHQKIDEVSHSICSLYGIECKLTIKKGYPPLVNNKLATDFARKSAIEYLDNQSVTDFEPKMWAEDFAYFAQRVPAVFWFLGVKQNVDEQTIPLHNPRLSPSEQALKIGTGAMAYIAFKAIKEF